MNDIFVIGATGQLGQSLRKIKPEWRYLSRTEIDLQNPTSITKYFVEKASLIINCAAFNAVDDAEVKKRDEAEAINVRAVGLLAACTRNFITVSSDYVFSGDKTSPYFETDPTGPLSFYGQTKLDGEKAALKANPKSTVIRTSWLYSEYGKNFVKWMLQLSQERDHLRLVDDQIGAPTYAGDLAAVIVKMAEMPERFAGEIYHYSNVGQCSRYEFTREIFRLRNIHTPVHPISSSEYPTPARRPKYSVFDTGKIAKATGLKVPLWSESLSRCLGYLTSNKI